MLKLRRGVVVGTEPLTVEVDGERRPAWADRGMVGEVRDGDDVVVNTEALDLGLGSGGFDVVHVNLTRGLEGSGPAGAHVMKLNYTSLQHAVEPVERSEEEIELGGAAGPPVLVIPLHGHLAPAAWAAVQVAPELRIGYLQTAGGALPGSLSRDVATLHERGLLCGHITAGPSYGGEREAITVTGALDAAAGLGWESVIAGPGPGILGSDTRYGHGAMAALDSAHAALALGLPTLVSPRLSEADPRPRHRGVSHHTETVLELLLGGVEVPIPSTASDAVATLEPLLVERHRGSAQPVDLDGYAASGLTTTVMGRDIGEDPLFFAAALAGGTALGGAARR
ncbi:MAG: DUF3866 family protein [Solirubrobacterales bacterium]